MRTSATRWLAFVLGPALVLTLDAPAQSPPAAAATQAAPAPDPQVELFARKCASCHTVGKGLRVGPDLKGTLDRRNRAWAERFIKTPSGMLDSDADARALLAQFNGVRMPDLRLKDAEVQGLVELIARCSGEPCDLAAKLVPVTAATDADVARGSDLFVGRTALLNGAAPCLSCHTALGTGAGIPGGVLAKDLTNVFARLGDEGLDSALKSPAFPVMNKVFADHPLQPEEVFALRAFLNQANRAQPADEAVLSVPLAGLLGTAGVLMALNAAWRKRLRGVRSGLTAKGRTR